MKLIQDDGVGTIIDIPKKQLKEVLSQSECDIDPSFLGFLNIYEPLSKIIPKHWTIVDLGCAYAPQCFYFKDYKRYVGVDISDCKRFKTKNTKHYTLTIKDFLEKWGDTFNKETTFAIVSYVPPWYGENNELVKKTFNNLFIYYPAH